MVYVLLIVFFKCIIFLGTKCSVICEKCQGSCFNANPIDTFKENDEENVDDSSTSRRINCNRRYHWVSKPNPKMSKSGYTCIRYIFCWLNVLLWVTGCGILGVGLWLRIAYEGYATLLPEYALLSADSLAIAVGTIAFLLAFCGCCGSWFQSRWMLITYFSLVVFMFVAEFLMGSLAFVFRERLGHTLREELQNGIRHHYNVTANGPNSLVTIWDHLQSEFHCCGVQNYEDWFMIDAWKTERWVPDSCCLPAAYLNQTDKPCGHTENRDDWYHKGCSDQVHMWFVQRLHIVGVVGLVVAFIQLFGLISSMLLFCTVKHKRTSYTYKSYEPNA